MKQIILVLMLMISLKGFSQSDNVVGKWAVLKKNETKKTGENITGKDEELYKSGEKYFEFTGEKKLIITENYGKRSQKLPYRINGDKIYIGKEERNKTPYAFTIAANTLTLVKQETKSKKGKTIVITEEVILQKN